MRTTGWQQGITEWDDAAAYDGMVASGAFDTSHDCWTSGDMEAQLSGSGSLEASSWASDNMHFMLSSGPDIKLNLHHVPSIRTVSAACRCALLICLSHHVGWEIAVVCWALTDTSIWWD